MGPSLRASREHILIVCPLRAKGTIRTGLLLSVPSFPASFSYSREGGLFGLPLRVSNEGLLRPRVARARENNRPLILFPGIFSFSYSISRRAGWEGP
jgi:hypothetical protein